VTAAVYLIISAIGLGGSTNLVFMIVVGIINWIMLFGYVRIIQRATSATTRHARAPILRAQERSKAVPLPERAASTSGR